MIKYWLFIICLLLTGGCSEKRELKPAASSLPLLDLEASITVSVPDTFTWNSLAKQVEMIPLQTTDDALMSGSTFVAHIGDDGLFLVDYQNGSFYQYDKQGNLLKRFRYVGNGPGEYVGIFYFFFDPVQQTVDIYDTESLKRVRYDREGKLIDEKALGDFAVPAFICSNYSIFQGMPDTEYQLVVTDPDWNRLGEYFPLKTGDYNEVRRSAVQLLSSRCVNRDNLLFNRPMEDTVYTVTDRGIEPLFILKKGKYDISFADLDRFMTSAVNRMTCLMWPRINAIPDYYLIEYKREGVSYQEIWNAENQQLVSRISYKTGFPFILPSGKQIRLPASTMYINDNTLIFSVPAEELEDEIEEVKVEDNPVLLVLTL